MGKESDLGKVFNIEDYRVKPVEGNISKWVEEISKDEFTTFRINKGKEEIDRLYSAGLYYIDD